MRPALAVSFLVLATLRDPCERIPDPPLPRETVWSGVDVQVSVVSPGYERTSTVTMRFLRGGRPAVLPGRVRVSCQGIRLEPSGDGYTAVLRTSLRRNPEYCCDVVGGEHDVAALCIPAPERPQLAWPLDDESVPRSEVVVRYYASTGTRVRVSASSGSGELQREDSFEPRPDDGDYPLDATGFSPGPGTLTLVRELEQDLSTVEFRSVHAKVSTSQTVRVAWK